MYCKHDCFKKAEAPKAPKAPPLIYTLAYTVHVVLQHGETQTQTGRWKGSKGRINTARQLNRSRHLPTILFLYLVLHIVSHPLLVPECLGQVLQALVLLVYDLLLTQSDLVISAQSSTVVSI